jgi:hypothetical protein
MINFKLKDHRTQLLVRQLNFKGDYNPMNSTTTPRDSKASVV